MKQLRLIIMGILAATLALAVACGGGAPPPTSEPPASVPSTGSQDSGGGPIPPHAFVGTVSVDGAPAADGTVVSARLEGMPEPVAQATVSGGKYVIKIVQRGDVPYANKKVTFKIGDADAAQSATWQMGGADELNLAVSAGGGGGADLVAQGQALFTGKGGCLACHTIEGLTAGLVGPDLTHIGAGAAGRKPGLSARAYIDESIRQPEAFVASGVERAIPGLMTSALTASLSDSEVDALVEFLLAQK